MTSQVAKYLKFGVKVTGEASWIVAKAATEGNFEITLTWDASGGEPSSGPPKPARPDDPRDNA